MERLATPPPPMSTLNRKAGIIKNQSNVSSVRNVCMLAHVDHGKTTLTDSLCSTNGLISSKQAGKVRFLDKRADEQEREITMEAHAVSLTYKEDYLINLIDSPGHVDFSADVSSAVRLCDGALLVVDVIEGVCVQTIAVSRIAWEEGLKMVLVLNKVDRLITELSLSLEEAHGHLFRLVESVNALLSGFNDEEEEEESFLFSPLKNNVVFTSGTDQWGFRLCDFLPLVRAQTGWTGTDSSLLNGMWDLHVGFDGKSIIKCDKVGNNMFCNFVLKPVWQVYEVCLMEDKPKKLQRMCDILRVQLPYNLRDKKQVMRDIMSQWLPLGPALMETVLAHVPNPAQSSQGRKIHVLFPEESPAKEWVSKCDASGPLVAFVSKMMAVNETEFLALGRVFSGTLCAHQAFQVIGPKHTVDECEGGESIQPMLMLGGSTGDCVPCDSIPCGNIFALRGVSKWVLKTATLSTLPNCPSLLKMPLQSAPLLRVSIEPKDPQNWDKLSRGLQLLNKADPVLEVTINPGTGQHLLGAIGELHLERCLKDLSELFAKVEFSVSEPLASFRETICHAVKNAPPQRLGGFEVRVLPLQSIMKDEPPFVETSVIKDMYTFISWNAYGNALVMAPGSMPLEESKEEVISGFQFACRSGPLCEEPLRDVCFVLSERKDTAEETATCSPGTNTTNNNPAFLAATFADTFKRAFRDCRINLRLVEAIYQCSFHCLAQGEQLGNLYSVIARRRGRVVNEGMVEGTTTLFLIEAHMPVVECVGLADELRSRTSGTASSPQLVFSHWEMLAINPEFKNTTEEELALEGETVQADRENNLAYKLMIQVRKRKGMDTGEKLVVSEKQRTLSRKF